KMVSANKLMISSLLFARGYTAFRVYVTTSNVTERGQSPPTAARHNSSSRILPDVFSTKRARIGTVRAPTIVVSSRIRWKTGEAPRSVKGSRLWRWFSHLPIYPISDEPIRFALLSKWTGQRERLACDESDSQTLFMRTNPSQNM